MVTRFLLVPYQLLQEENVLDPVGSWIGGFHRQVGFPARMEGIVWWLRRGHQKTASARRWGLVCPPGSDLITLATVVAIAQMISHVRQVAHYQHVQAFLAAAHRLKFQIQLLLVLLVTIIYVRQHNVVFNPLLAPHIVVEVNLKTPRPFAQAQHVWTRTLILAAYQILHAVALTALPPLVVRDILNLEAPILAVVIIAPFQHAVTLIKIARAGLKGEENVPPDNILLVRIRGHIVKEQHVRRVNAVQQIHSVALAIVPASPDNLYLDPKATICATATECGNCCKSIPTCADWSKTAGSSPCPSGHSLTSTAKYCTSNNYQCNQAQCCVTDAVCTAADCSLQTDLQNPYLLLSDGKPNTCAGPTCTAADKCCGEQQQCSAGYNNKSFTCGDEGYDANANHFCATGTCTAAECCGTDPKCSAGICTFDQYLLTPVPSCKGAPAKGSTTPTCTPDACCGQKTQCKTYLKTQTGGKCPAGQHSKDDDHYCSDNDYKCSNAECCADNPTCAEWAGCPEGTSANPAWAANRCSTNDCTGAAKECCIPNEKCKQWDGSCKPKFHRNSLLADSTCQGLTCNWDECCIKNPMCSDWPCVDTFYKNKTHIVNASQTPCSGTDAPWCSDAECCQDNPTGRLPEINKWPLYDGSSTDSALSQWSGPPDVQPGVQTTISNDIANFQKIYNTDIRNDIMRFPNAL